MGTIKVMTIGVDEGNSTIEVESIENNIVGMQSVVNGVLRYNPLENGIGIITGKRDKNVGNALPTVLVSRGGKVVNELYGRIIIVAKNSVGNNISMTSEQIEAVDKSIWSYKVGKIGDREISIPCIEVETIENKLSK